LALFINSAVVPVVVKNTNIQIYEDGGLTADMLMILLVNVLKPINYLVNLS